MSMSVQKSDDAAATVEQRILALALAVMPNTALIESEEQAEDIVAVWRAAQANGAVFSAGSGAESDATANVAELLERVAVAVEEMDACVRACCGHERAGEGCSEYDPEAVKRWRLALSGLASHFGVWPR